MHPCRFTSTPRWKVLLAICSVTAGLISPLTAIPAAQATPTVTTAVTRTIKLGGTSTYHSTAAGKDLYAGKSEIRQSAEPDADAPTVASDQLSQTRALLTASTSAPAANRVIARTGAKLIQSFQGLNHHDQRTANNGNQFSLEPPDQGLCVGRGFVVEPINDVIRVYSTKGAPATGVEDLNSFFGYPAAILRTATPVVFGPFITDPSCLFDPTTRQFFLTALTLEVDPATGDFTGQNHLDVAVTNHPTGAWSLYHLDVTDDGTNGTPVHPHCPCIGDYPHIGVDSHGFYVTTNEYSFFGPQYNAAQLYAFSKFALANHARNLFVTQYDTTGAVDGNPGFTVWPAQSPDASQFATARHGTEYFLSSNATELEAHGTGASNHIVVWALTKTATVGTSHPEATLTNHLLGVHTYSVPPPSDQKPGPTPLRDCLNNITCATALNGEPDKFAPEPISQLDSNDSRMQQVTYAGGKLYGALDTAVTVGGETKAGIAYYVVRPNASGRHVSAHLLKQGTLALANNNLTYPAIGITSAGKGIVAFTLVGADYFPSAAFAGFDAKNGPAGIQVAGAGVGPDDGFSGYGYYGNTPGVPDHRWGDYGATAVSGSKIWAASEYIAQSCTLDEYLAAPLGTCDATRTVLANWSTRISEIEP